MRFTVVVGLVILVLALPGRRRRKLNLAVDGSVFWPGVGILYYFALPTPIFFPLPKKVTPKEHERKDLVILLFSSWVDLPTSRLGVPKASRDKLVSG